MVYTYNMGSLINNIILATSLTLAGSFAFAYLISLLKINKLNYQINKLGDTNILLTQKLLLKIEKINNILLRNKN